MFFHVCCNIRLRNRFSIHIHHRIWSTPSTRMSLCNCRWFLHCHGPERESLISDISCYDICICIHVCFAYCICICICICICVCVCLWKRVCTATRARVCSWIYICPGAQGTLVASYISVPIEWGLAWAGRGEWACRWAAVVSSCAFVYELPNKCVKCRRRYCHWRDTLPSPTSSSSHTRVCEVYKHLYVCLCVCVMVCLLCMTFGNFAYLSVSFYLFLFSVLITLTKWVLPASQVAMLLYAHIIP